MQDGIPLLLLAIILKEYDWVGFKDNDFRVKLQKVFVEQHLSLNWCLTTGAKVECAVSVVRENAIIKPSIGMRGSKEQDVNIVGPFGFLQSSQGMTSALTVAQIASYPIFQSAASDNKPNIKHGTKNHVLHQVN